MEDVIPNIYDVSISKKIDEPYVENGEAILKSYFNFIKQEKSKRKNAADLLIAFMNANREQIMKRIIKRKLKMTFEQAVEIAIGWSLDDIDSLIDLAKKKKIREFVNQLLSY